MHLRSGIKKGPLEKLAGLWFYLLLSAAVTLILIFSGLLISGAKRTTVAISSSGGDKTFSAEIADNLLSRARGLMGRESLSKNEGMLFVFGDEAPRSFWMMNTLIPLDIVFIAANKTVVDVQTMEPCKADTCRTYASRAPAKYALEVNAGGAKDVNLGDLVFISAY